MSSVPYLPVPDNPLGGGGSLNSSSIVTVPA